MGEKTGVSWTHHTVNFWIGCDQVSPGCAHCYAKTLTERWGKDFSILRRTSDATFYAPLKWKEPALVFTCSMSDFFHEDADQWRDDAWDVIRRTPHLTWQILTKRPERILEHLPADWGALGWSNVWMGTSVENQHFADIRIPLLLKVPAVVRFLSCEPLLGPLDLVKATPADEWGWEEVNRIDDGDFPEMEIEECELEADWINYGNSMVPNPAYREHMEWRERTARFYTLRDNLHWVIVGGESGKGFRVMDPRWPRDILKQCEETGIAFFYKQGSSFKPGQDATLDGVEYHQFPRDLSAVGV